MPKPEAAYLSTGVGAQTRVMSAPVRRGLHRRAIDAQCPEVLGAGELISGALALVNLSVGRPKGFAHFGRTIVLDALDLLQSLIDGWFVGQQV
jgi:hypothetical protein